MAEIHNEGGFAGTQMKLQPPAVVVYSDGTVVLGTTNHYTLSPTNLNALISEVRADLNGLPGTVTPTNSRPIPDIATTVLGVRKADGSYQTVRAAGLPEIGKQGGYPAPLVDAYSKLNGLNDTIGAKFTGPNVRYMLSCPVTNSTKPLPWPTGLPQPVNAEGPSCTEVHVGVGPVAAAVRAACVSYIPTAGSQTRTALPYQSDKGVRTCVWRYALPDETS